MNIANHRKICDDKLCKQLAERLKTIWYDSFGDMQKPILRMLVMGCPVLDVQLSSEFLTLSLKFAFFDL